MSTLFATLQALLGNVAPLAIIDDDWCRQMKMHPGKMLRSICEETIISPLQNDSCDVSMIVTARADYWVSGMPQIKFRNGNRIALGGILLQSLLCLFEVNREHYKPRIGLWQLTARSLGNRKQTPHCGVHKGSSRPTNGWITFIRFAFAFAS